MADNPHILRKARVVADLALEDVRIVANPDYAGVGYKRSVAEATNMGDHWYINRVLVNPPEIRGRGMGHALVETLCIEIRKLGGTKVVVTPGGYDPNDKARQIRFYETCGFVEDPTEKGLFYRSLPGRRA